MKFGRHMRMQGTGRAPGRIILSEPGLQEVMTPLAKCLGKNSCEKPANPHMVSMARPAPTGIPVIGKLRKISMR